MQEHITGVIIDDEAHCRDSMRSLLHSYVPEVNLIGEASNVADGIQLIKEHNPAIVFLDVEMPHASGFDLLDMLEEKSVQVIFVTAHDKYAIKAIKYCAIDFLLKPVNVLELKTSVKRLDSQVTINRIGIYNANAKAADPAKRRIVLPCSDGFVVKEMKDIIRLEANDNYTWVYNTNKEKLLVCRTLKEFEEMLETTGFVRVHQSHLINEEHVQRYIKGAGGYVQMSDGSLIEVSRRKKDDFLERFMK